ncbi:MAG TPA: HAMP domain-containing sensor histidine kinase [Kofleriaceae bacterium]|nr:HAMP domain-containing sensor histidine kinase [Kofleriaceae bacterium]
MGWATAASRAAAHLARIRYRLLLVNVIVVAVPLAGVVFARMHERQLLAALERDMVHQAELVRALVADDGTGPRLADRGPALASAARHTRTRIRLLDERGRVVADSHAAGPPEGAEPAVPHLYGGTGPTHAPEVPEAQDVSSRREVQTALAGRYGSATRLWGNQERVYLFAALPITRSTPSGTHVDGIVYVTRSTQTVKLQLFRLRTWLFDLLLAALALTTILSLFLAATIARPLGKLTRAAERMAAGDRDVRLALDRADEIGQLSRALERMATELDRRARDQRALAADISHELKTPLTGIRGAAELLRDGAADDAPARARFLAMILDDAARLDRLVVRLLELSRLESDDAALEDTDVAALAAAALTRTAERTGVATRIDAPGPPTTRDAVRLRVRPAALEAALDNLLANAAQHATPGTPITLTVTPSGRRRHRRVRLAVHDHGAPISAAVQARVWDRFFTTRAAEGGSGLGLAIVRAVATAHGGAVGVESTARGGTTFWIELPA